METTKQYLYDVIKSRKDNRKDTTINQYVRSIIKVLKGIEYKNMDKIKSLQFLNDTKSIDTFINTIETISTKRNLYTALLSLIKINEDDKIYSHYKKKEQEGNDNQKKLYDNEKMNEKKTDKYNSTSSKDIIKLMNTLLKEEDYMNYIMISLIYHYGYRNEISSLQVISLKEFKRLKEDERRDNNYLVVGSKTFKIVRYKYKTDKHYGAIENDIDDKKLRNVMKKYIKSIDTKYLFTDKKGNVFNNQQITDRLRYITKKYLNIEITGTLIYKLNMEQYIKHNEELKEKARIRGHSQQVQSSIYIQNPS